MTTTKQRKEKKVPNIVLIDAQDKIRLSDEYKNRLETFLREVLSRERDVMPDRLSDINVVIVDNSYISDLNERYLGRQGPTDVLSFELDDVAEIYVSAEYDPESIHHFALHGLLHVLGYDHKIESDAKVMRLREEEYLKLWNNLR